MLGVVTDTVTGQLLESFEFKTANRLQFTVLAEDQECVALLREAFVAASQMPPVKKSYAKIIGSQIQ